MRQLPTDARELRDIRNFLLSMAAKDYSIMLTIAPRMCVATAMGVGSLSCYVLPPLFLAVYHCVH